MNEVTFEHYLQASEHALANFLGTDELDKTMIELVADCCREAVAVLPNWTHFWNLLEKASTYVLVDMDEGELNDFTGELEEQLGDYGVI